MKILNLVKINDGIGIVLDVPKKLTYKEYTINSQKFLVGADGIFYNVLQYKYDSMFKAFAGREFTVKMDDGTKKTLKNVWWSCNDKNLIKRLTNIDAEHIAVGDIEALKKCYVFSAAMVDSGWLKKNTELCQDKKVYEYWDYEKLLKK